MTADMSSARQELGHTSSSFDEGGNWNDRNTDPVPGSSSLAMNATTKVMKHNPGIAMDWSAEEQSMLEEGLKLFASDTNVIRYAKIAMQLQDKTVRDVALRCRWISRRENNKRKKEDQSVSKKSGKEKIDVPSARLPQSVWRPDSSPNVDTDDGTPFKATGISTVELLESNALAFNQIAANLSSLKIEDNINLFCQARDNLQLLLNSCSSEEGPGAMKNMPPLPHKLNEELMNSILHPPASHIRPRHEP